MALTQEKAERIAQEWAKIDYKDMTTPLLVLGYAPSYAQTLGHKLYKNIKVIDAVKQIKAAVSEKTGITIRYVVDKLRGVAERCTEPDTYDAGGANRALQLLGMHVDAFNADNKSKAVDARTFNLTQIRAILDADKAKCKEIDGITGGIAGESIVGHTGGL